MIGYDQQVWFITKQQAAVAIQIEFQGSSIECATYKRVRFVSSLGQCACVPACNAFMAEDDNPHSRFSLLAHHLSPNYSVQAPGTLTQILRLLPHAPPQTFP